MKSSMALLAGGVLFALAATANSGGYRYGISDQSFYIPAVEMTLDPALFPRDREVLWPQVRMWPGRHLFAVATRVFKIGTPELFAFVYLLTLVVLYAAAVSFGRALGLGPWALTAFLALLTLRHQIAKTGANSLEGYMHPRMLAFAIGLASLGWLLRGRILVAWIAVAAAALVHPTTAIWFGAVLAAASVVTSGSGGRTSGLASAAAAVAIASIALITIMRPDFSVMDPAWRNAIQDRDYLFASEWPVSAWLLNLLYPVVIGAIYLLRRRTGRDRPDELALIVGLLVLVAGFLASVVFAAMGIVAVVQLQVPRVFWLLDAIAAAYLAWWLIDDVAARRTASLKMVIVAGLVLLSAARGYYVLRVMAGRPLARVELAPQDWADVMAWLRRQPAGWHVLADPGHVWFYGSSIRSAALHDTLLEIGKDTAMALYDRRTALRVAERTAALANPLTDGDLARLDERYGLDVLVFENTTSFNRPVLYRSGRFTVYDLR